MTNRRDELKEFKQRINLTEYAAAFGYQLDRKASSRNSAVLRHAGGDKIIVAKAEDGNWVYFSVHDGEDSPRFIVAETAIDALSYAALKGSAGSRFVSTAGEMNPDQMILLESAIRKLPSNAQLVLAVDHDAGGDKIGARIEAIFKSIGRSDLAITRDAPLTHGEDWNDQLRKPADSATQSPAYRPKFPSK